MYHLAEEDNMKIIDNYRDLPIGMYLDICAIDKDESIDELQRQVSIIAILTGRTEEEIYNLPLEQYRELAAKTSFLAREYDGEVLTAKTYGINGMVLIPIDDYRKITTAQYIDFQTFAREPEKNIVELLSCMLVPKGKKYNQDYDVLELQKALRMHLSVADALSLLAFFFHQMASVNQGFTNLLQGGSNEVERSGEEEESSEGDTEARGFAERWGWIANVDAVSETCRCSWDEVWVMTAIEFLNILAYRKDKAEKEKADIERWKRRN